MQCWHLTTPYEKIQLLFSMKFCSMKVMGEWNNIFIMIIVQIDDFVVIINCLIFLFNLDMTALPEHLQCPLVEMDSTTCLVIY